MKQDDFLAPPPPAAGDGPPVSPVEEKRARAKKAAEPTFFEYMAPDGKPWRCDAPDRLFADFGIVGDTDKRQDELTRLHGDVAVVKEGWDVIRRVYRLAPVIGPTKDDLREWTIEDVAREANVPVKRVEVIIEETKVYWQRKNNERALVDRAVASPDRCIGGTVEAIGDLDEGQIAKLLSRHGFEEVPAEYRRFMARRIVEFQHLLDDEQGAYLARSALNQELILMEYDRAIRLEMSKDRVSRGADALDKLVTRRSGLQSTYESTLEKLGATQEQNPGHRAKVAFGDSLGFMARAVQEYYSDENNALIDGLFTAAEIKLLLTPTELRPSQYRPDLALLVEQWRVNFWNPKWEGAKIPREMHRFLIATFLKASQEFLEGKTAEMDADEVAEGDVEIATDIAMGEAVAATGGEGAVDLAMPAPSAFPAPVRGAPRGGKFEGWAS